MNFDESVTYLYSLGNEVLAMKLGLENIGKLLRSLGNPHEKFLKVQIAGTNGKGSTCAFLDAICRSAGIKTGLYTSPHLVCVTERIKIAGEEISEKDFARHATRIRDISEDLVKKGELEAIPTFFEQMTAIAISAFGEAEIELGILETGLGGRFDATTATNAEIVAITPIDYDHQQILGNTLAEIAGEKAAIIRKDTKVILAGQKEEAKKVILGKCLEVGLEPVWATTNIKIKIQGKETGKRFLMETFATEHEIYSDVVLGLNGRHQITNASTAISIAEALRRVCFKITNDNIRTGLGTAQHKGRLEFYKNILFDGAHNVAGAEALRAYFDEFIEPPLTIIFGAMRDKALSEIAEILFPKADKLIFTKPDNPRSMDTENLLEFLPENFDIENVFQTQTVEEALKLAGKISGATNLTCVTGSLYLVGEAQKILSENVLNP